MDESERDPGKIYATAQVCNLLRRRCSGTRTRSVVCNAERPSRWQPGRVLNPETGEPFLVTEAWKFIADALGRACAVEIVELRKPPEKKGYVLKLAGAGGEVVYVKLEIGPDVVFGRSFHVSNPEGGSE